MPETIETIYRLIDGDCNCWQCSECGLEWVLSNADNPTENQMNFCPCCGRKIVRLVTDARLMAAAPEMYEALRWLLHLAHDVSKAGPDFPITEEEWADAWESAKAALERAERGDGEVD